MIGRSPPIAIREQRIKSALIVVNSIEKYLCSSKRFNTNCCPDRFGLVLHKLCVRIALPTLNAPFTIRLKVSQSLMKSKFLASICCEMKRFKLKKMVIFCYKLL